MKSASSNAAAQRRPEIRRGLPLSLCLVAVLSCTSAYSGITELDVVGPLAVSAEPEGEGPTERQRPGGTREPTPGTAATTSGQAERSVIKCWQKGTLLLQEEGWSLVETGGRRAAQVEFQKPGNGDPRMYWINLGETFCFMKSK